MATITRTETYLIPSYAITAIEYGDFSGLEEDDIPLVEEFMTRTAGASYQWGDESEFTWKPEFGLASDCVECTATWFD